MTTWFRPATRSPDRICLHDMTPAKSFPSPARIGAHAHRAADVIAILIKFGFTELVQQTGLRKYIPGGKQESKELAKAREKLPVRVRMLLEELGPTYIKVGQILSTRPDLVPPSWIVELKKLQTEVPPAPWEGEHGIRAVLEREYGGDLEREFEWIDEASLAAASIAQVHRARLRTGEEVVIKILRPGIIEKIRSDMDFMAWFARMTEDHFTNLGFDAEAVVDQFRRQLDRETDLSNEGKAVARMREDFGDHKGVTFPKVHDHLTTPSVLVMEEIHGTLLTRLDLSTLTDEQRERIVKNGADAVFRQCLIIGYFHADPHPGNIFVLEDEKICFIDCGMTGTVDPGTKRQLAEIVHGTIEGDLNRVVKTAIRIGNADPALEEDRHLRETAWQLVDHFHGGTLGSIRIGALLDEFFGLLRKHNLRCPADIVYLIKALTTIEGVAQEVAPDFDLVSYVKPYVERLVRQRYSFRAMRRRLTSAVMAYGDLIEDLPGLVGDIIRNVRRNNISMNLEHRGLDRLTREMERASMNISWALVLASFVVGASLLVLADSADGEPSSLSTLALWGFVVAVILGVFRLIVSHWGK